MYAINFNINFFKNTINSIRKLAIYFVILDIHNNPLEYGYAYNLSTPYACYFNTSDYTSPTVDNPITVNFTDYYDISSFTPGIYQIQMNYYSERSLISTMIGSINFVKTSI